MRPIVTTARINGLSVNIGENYADVLLTALGHIFVDPDEKTLRPITPVTYVRLMNSLRRVPLATVDMLDRIEQVADVVFPDTDRYTPWLWELPPDDFCPNCSA